jgi:uncharacterized membrane protein
MGGTGTDTSVVTAAGGGSIIAGVRVASKPAFALVVGAVAFLAQDLFTRLTHITVSNDEAVAFVTALSWVAYWIVPPSLQDGGATVVAGPLTAPTV